MATEVKRSGSRLPALFALLGVFALVAGIAIGAAWHSGHEDQWHTGTGYAGADQVSVQYKGWYYAAGSSMQWIDTQGTWHDDGWPSCLHRYKTQSVRFQSRAVTVDGVTSRPIVAIDCR